jgi:hypothetical protein
MDKKEAALLIKQIDSLYPGKINLEPLTVEVWHRALNKQDYEKTVDTLIKYSRENKFPPSVADLFIREVEAHSSNILEKMKEWERNAARK